MNFCHSEEHLDLRLGARDFLRAEYSGKVLRDLIADNLKFPEHWTTLVEMGLVNLMGPETHGGLNMNATGFSLIAQEAGYVALPLPLNNIAGVSIPLLNLINVELPQLAALAKGDLKIHTVHPVNPFVNHYASGDYLLSFINNEIHLLSSNEIEIKPVTSIDPLRQLSRVTSNTSNKTLLAKGDETQKLQQCALLHGALFASAELLGLTVAMIDMSTAYAKERKQFGKPIGSFQAVKHHLANAFVKLEFARPCVYRAAASLSSSDPAVGQHIAHAKIAATDAALFAAEVAIQVHGAMGYTYEVDLHLWMKKVWALAGIWGDRNYHMKVIDQTVFSGATTIGPAQTFSRAA